MHPHLRELPANKSHCSRSSLHSSRKGHACSMWMQAARGRNSQPHITHRNSHHHHIGSSFETWFSFLTCVRHDGAASTLLGLHSAVHESQSKRNRHASDASDPATFPQSAGWIRAVCDVSPIPINNTWNADAIPSRSFSPTCRRRETRRKSSKNGTRPGNATHLFDVDGVQGSLFC